VATPGTSEFLAGVIEGFYGQPWTQADRLELFDWMASWGLNTYLYAPKDDLKHRVAWREPYSASEAATMGQLVQACRSRNLRFIYALSPGLDLRYAQEADLDSLVKRFAQMQALGCRDFALFFDDIPDRQNTDDVRRWGSLAAAQCHVANAMCRWARERCAEARFLFCPTAYCGRMAARHFGGHGYLASVGQELLPEIDVCWTGPEIISREITVPHVQQIETVLRRRPVIWDNLHANDYDGRRFFCGPYAGRAPDLRNHVLGILSNPNNEFPVNYVPLRTLAAFLRNTGTWDARQAFFSAMQEWLPQFAGLGPPLALEDLVLLADCYYLPHEDGPEAVALYERAEALLTCNPTLWSDQAAAFRRQAARLREVCARMTELHHRPLFHALSRRVWELREELDLLDRYVQMKSTRDGQNLPCLSDFHQPGTFRGGLVARLQRLLVQQPDGTFLPARTGQREVVDHPTKPAASGES
jgi:protein O-GlcNAcase/histone acetyltransferase